MSALLRSELRKVRSARGHASLAPIGIAVGLLFSVMYLASSTLTADDARTALANAGASGIFVALFGLVSVTAESRHGTLGVSLTVSPHRGRLLLAKLTVAGGVGLASAVAAMGLQSALLAVWFGVEGASIGISASQWANVALGTMVSFPLLAVVGVGAGALLRDQTLAVVVLLVLLLLVEPAVSGAWGAFLGPFTAAQAAQANEVLEVADASQTKGATVLLGWAMMLFALGLAVFQRQEVR